MWMLTHDQKVSESFFGSTAEEKLPAKSLDKAMLEIVFIQPRQIPGIELWRKHQFVLRHRYN